MIINIVIRVNIYNTFFTLNLFVTHIYMTSSFDEIVLRNTLKQQQNYKRNFFSSMYVNKFHKQLLSLNELTATLNSQLITDLSALSFFTDNKNYFNKTKINEIFNENSVGQRTLSQLINENVDPNIILKIFVQTEQTDNPILNENTYKMVNGMQKQKNGNIFAFCDSTVLDIYIGSILQILNIPSLCTYITFYISENNKFISYEEFFKYTLYDLIKSPKQINAEEIKNIISAVLKILCKIKSNKHGFDHGDLVCENIFFINENEIVIGNLGNSSMTWNGIRFCNKNIKNNEIQNMTLDIYVFLFSLLFNLFYYKIINDSLNFEEKFEFLKMEFRNVFSKIISEHLYDEITIAIHEKLEKQKNVVEIIKFKKREMMKNFDITIYEDETDFKRNFSINTYDKQLWYHDVSNDLHLFFVQKNEYFKSIKTYALAHMNDYNIDAIYINFFNKETEIPSMYDYKSNENYIYKTNENYYFIIAEEPNGDVNLCINECNKKENNLFYCHTNNCNADGVKEIINCTPFPSIHESIEYKILIKLISYFPNGNIDANLINNDIEWRSLFGIMFDNELITMDYNCDSSFIFEGSLLEKNSKSNSIQYTNINVNDITSSFNIKFNNAKMNNLMQIIKKNCDCSFDDSTSDNIKKNIIDLFLNAMKSYNKFFFAKINFIYDETTRRYFSSSNKMINNEKIAYLITNKLIYYNNTPHVSYMILNSKCKNDTYFYKKLETIINNKSELDNIISSEIFLNEMIEGNIRLFDFILNLKKNNTLENKETNKNIFISIMIQIAYTLECFNRICFIHHDLHTNNIFIEKLPQEKTIYYVLTNNSTDNKKINKIIKLKTKYFIKIFDFDRSFTLNSRPNNIPQITSPLITNAQTYETTLKNFDFIYVCRWIHFTNNVITSYNNYPKVEFITDVIKDILSDNAFNSTNATPHPNDISFIKDYKKNQFTWLTDLDKTINLNNSDTIKIYDINDLYNDTMDNSKFSFDNKTRIYILPESDVNYLSTEFNKNAVWKNTNFYTKINNCANITKDENIKKITTEIVKIFDITEQVTFFNDPESFQKKYLKYKNKYLSLKNKI